MLISQDLNFKALENLKFSNNLNQYQICIGWCDLQEDFFI